VWIVQLLRGVRERERRTKLNHKDGQDAGSVQVVYRWHLMENRKAVRCFDTARRFGLLCSPDADLKGKG
jgi:hypothetical protein